MRELLATRVPVALAAMTAAQSFSTLAAYAVPIVAVQVALGYGVRPTLVGGYSAIVYLAAMLFGLAAGNVIARYGAVRTAQIALVACGVGLVAVTTGVSLAIAGVGALLIGLGLGPMNPLASHVLARHAPVHWLPLVLSVKQTGTPIGGLLAGLIIPPLVALYDWRAAMLIVAAIPLLTAALLQPIRAELDDDRDASRRLSVRGVAETARLVLESRPLLVLGGCAFFYTTAQLGVVTFMVVYLEDAHGLPKAAAGGIFAIVHASAIPARVLWGSIAGRFVLPWRLLGILGLVMAASIAAFAHYETGWPFLLVTAVAILMGVSMNGVLGLLLAEFARLAPAGRVGEATGGGQLFTYGGVFFGPILFGTLVELSGGYTLAILTAAGVAGVAGLSLLLTIRLARLPVREPARRP